LVAYEDVCLMPIPPNLHIEACYYQVMCTS
jgi:hypothetical protein